MADENQNDGTGTEGQSNQEGNSQGENNGQNGNQNDNSGQGAGDDDNGNQGGKSENADETVSRAEFNALTERMKAADRRASAAEAKVKEHEDKNKSELDKAKEAAETARKEAEKARADLTKSKLDNAFLTNTAVVWNDPADALTLANLDGVVQEDGTIDDKLLKTRIDDLAKKKPYLVKPTTEASGSGGNGKRKGEDDKRTKEQLAKRFPALNHR